MVGTVKSDAGIASYELEIEIAAPPERVWDALINGTNAWWLPDFRMVAPSSTVRFDARAGGHLIEELDGGGSLLWYTVHLVQPEAHTVHLVGPLAPDWGGPSTTYLKLAIETRGDGSVLKVSDTHHGRIDDTTLDQLQGGWKSLFGDGLKGFVEAQ